jgi:hypothetical protein
MSFSVLPALELKPDRENVVDAGTAILGASPEVRVGSNDELPVAMHRRPCMSKHVETVPLVDRTVL